MMDTSTILDLVGSVHEAALHPEQFSAILERLGGLLCGSVVRFGLVDIATGFNVEFQSAADAAIERTFKERFLTPATNPGLRFMLSAPPMTIVPREAIQPDRDMLKSDFYHDIMRPYDGWHAATGAPYRDASKLVAFGAIRPQAADAFDTEEIAALRLILPHFQRSIRVMCHTAELEARASAAEAALARFSCAVIVTDASGRIASLNAQASAALEAADGLLIRDGRITAASREDRVRLARLIHDAAGGPGPRAHRRAGVMSVTRRPGRRPLELAVTPLRGRAATSAAYAVSIAFTDPEGAPGSRMEVLAPLFRLTRREAEVARLLLEGRSPGEAAEIMSIRISTMRTHIQHLFQKTDTSRLPELVNLLYRS
jgi:DNA-binding CsgD family transcriptional regulator